MLFISYQQFGNEKITITKLAFSFDFDGNTQAEISVTNVYTAQNMFQCFGPLRKQPVYFFCNKSGFISDYATSSQGPGKACPVRIATHQVLRH